MLDAYVIGRSKESAEAVCERLGLPKEAAITDWQANNHLRGLNLGTKLYLTDGLKMELSRYKRVCGVTVEYV